MSHGRVAALSTLAAVIALAVAAHAQSVISTHAGLIHFFEGAVYLGDQPLESRLGKYTTMPQGAELRTADGRAEVLLTPGVFLRMGEQSAIRLIASDLADTQVELRTGAVMVDAGEPNADTSVTLVYKDWRVHFLQKGVYRIDSDPPRLWVRQGKAEAYAAPGGKPESGKPVSVDQGMVLPFARVLLADRYANEPADTLKDWSRGRGESISADNTITAQIDEDPASRPPGAEGDNFSYFPMLGVLSPNPVGPGVYSSYYPAQPGFNSIYLPGYSYRPIMLGLSVHSYRTLLPSTPGARIGIYRSIGVTSPGTLSPGFGSISPFPRGPGAITPVTRPAAPVFRPAPVTHPAPHPGPAVGHR
jgi:hypothetical protein